ncbi:hypothetical protein ABKN59_011287 [Abortiporus biennis]
MNTRSSYHQPVTVVANTYNLELDHQVTNLLAFIFIMARSEISAKKSTGAPAPRTPFPTATDDTTPRRKTRSSLSNSKQTAAPPPPKTKAKTTRRQSKSNAEAAENQGISNQECCYLCGNGGNIIDCETCPNAVCFHCIPEISNIKKTVLNTLTFRCSKCQYDTTKSKTAFVGLYKSNGQPFQPTPLKVEIPEYVLQRQKFRTPPVLILCFRLASLPERGTAPSLTYETLLGAYLSEGDKIHYEDIPFDLSTNNGIRAHNDRLNQIHELIESQEWSHVLLFITTHSDDDRGDLWYGTKVACEIDQFFEHVIGTDTLESLRNITTSCFLFACGALVKYKESFDATKLQVEKFNIDRFLSTRSFSPIEIPHKTLNECCQKLKILVNIRHLSSSLQHLQ